MKVHWNNNEGVRFVGIPQDVRGLRKISVEVVAVVDGFESSVYQANGGFAYKCDVFMP